MTIQEKNEMIAVFCGYHVYDEGMTRWILNDSKLGGAVSDLRYHESWTWLMPVIENISKMPLMDIGDIPCTHPQDVCYPITFGMPTEDGKQVMFRFKGFACHTADTLIEAAYEACFGAIQYFNKQGL